MACSTPPHEMLHVVPTVFPGTVSTSPVAGFVNGAWQMYSQLPGSAPAMTGSGP